MTAVLKVQDVTSEPTVEHELAFVKIRATDGNRDEVLRLVGLSRARVVDLSDGSVIVEVTGTESEIDAFVALARTYGIKELVRTGAVVMARGAGSIEEEIKRCADACTTTTTRARAPWPGRRSRSSAMGRRGMPMP